MLPPRPIAHPLPLNPFNPSAPPPPPPPVPSVAIPVAGPSRLPALVSSGQTTASASASAAASSSTALASSSTCAQCSQPPKYTCPGCSRRTCSAICSKAHKARFSCDGTRDPTTFVPLKEFGQGEWAGDYSWLEEGRRKVMAWGEGLGSDAAGIDTIGGSDSRGPGSRGRGRGGIASGTRNGNDRVAIGGRDKNGRPKSKVETMRRQLVYRGYWVEIMASGMARRLMNQSSWNPRTQKLYLHIELSIPTVLLDPSLAQTSSERSTTTTLSHRILLISPNDTSPTLNSLLSDTLHPKNATKSKAQLHPQSTSEQVTNAQSNSIPDKEEKPSPALTYLLPFHASPSNPAPPHKPTTKLYFPPLDPSRPLAESLKGTAWIEYPVIEVIPTQEWEARVRRGEVGLGTLAQVHSQASGKRGQREVGNGDERERDSGWGSKRKAGVSAAADEGGSGKKSRGMAGSGELVGKQKVEAKAKADQGLLALGEYESDEEDEQEVEDLAGVVGTEGGEEAKEEDEGEDDDCDGDEKDGEVREDHEGHDLDDQADDNDDDDNEDTDNDDMDDAEGGDQEAPIGERDLAVLQAVGNALIADLG